ncbi:kinase-like domain, phloem protein 2-like protein [Tanacetum coccineum]
MESFTKEFKHLLVKLEDIKSATNNFDEKKVIGSGGFGKVYKGEVSHVKGRSMVAVKRLDRKFGQGDPEFRREIMMLSRYTHENLISLLGYCNEGGEMILVYLKDDKGTQQRVIHRDIKSSNILLDENWNAKVYDMGLSKIGPANQMHTSTPLFSPMLLVPVGAISSGEAFIKTMLKGVKTHVEDTNYCLHQSHTPLTSSLRFPHIFGEVLVITAGYKFELVNEIKPEVLSPDTTYASYFVYKLPSDQSKFEFPLKVSNKRGEYYYMHTYSYLVSPPNTPVIGQKFDENCYNPLNRHKLSALPRQRTDGWMEVKVWEFQTKKTPETVSMNLKLKHPAMKDLSGLIIHGIELRPIKILFF